MVDFPETVKSFNLALRQMTLLRYYSNSSPPNCFVAAYVNINS